MINNELKEYNRLLLLAHSDTSTKSEQPETRTYNYMSVPESTTVVYWLINHGIFVHYRHTRGSC